MTAANSGENETPAKGGFLRRVTCVKRYGRATLTIRRWGAWTELLGDSDLSRALDRYRDGKVSADEVASTFVTSRVKVHSPTFSWETANPDRVLQMVAGCSTEPVFEATDAKHVADQLLTTQDEQRERMKQVGAQLVRSAQPALAVMSQFANTIASLGQMVSLRNAALMKAVATIKLADSTALGRWMAVAPRFEPQPALGQWLSGQLAVPSLASLRLSSLDLSRLGAPDLASTLAGIHAASPAFAIPGILLRSAGRGELGVGELLGAGHSAADLVGALGDAQGAEAISSVMSDAEEVLETPGLDAVAQAINRLVDVMEDNERQRQRDSDENANSELIRWVFTMILTIYVALWPYLFRP